MASATKRDYYDVLGVTRDAPLEDIKRAYRQAALRYHPDRNPDPAAEDMFKEASEAFEVLADDNKRRVYDVYGHEGLRGGGYGGIADVDDVFEHFFTAGGVFGDLLADLFGARRPSRGRQASRGADLLAGVTVSLEEVARGLARDVEVERLRTCGECGGSGAADGAGRQVCPACRGTGQALQRHGFFTVSTTCPRCRGEGDMVATPCGTCGGRGLRLERTSLPVDIPAGLADGARMRLPGEGEDGRLGGPAGDLYVEVRVKPHKTFGRDGQDTVYELGLTPSRAALGGKVTVPTLWGNESVNVPAGSQHGDVLVVRGGGLPHVRAGGRGDQRVILNVKVPRKLKGRAKDLYKELLALEGEEA